MQQYRIIFRGGPEECPHEEAFGLKAENIEAAKQKALRVMRDEFHLRYPVIYAIEELTQSVETEWIG